MKKAAHFPLHFRDSALEPISTLSDFYPKARILRTQFEKTFSNPLHANVDRFCWDYWSVPNQYRLLRTPADSFFEPKSFHLFLSHLLNWGRRNLGCQMISKPWLSAYIDGSFQNLHSDVPHGPFSFVYSLTPWKHRTFTGGETLVTKPRLLRYFSELNPKVSHEEKDFFTRIPAHFNQLTVFDPRYPHGVERVQGVESVLESRLVIHGWFTDPRPMIEGSLTVKKVQKSLDEVAHFLLHEFSLLPYSGLFSVRFQIKASGEIAKADILACHLVDGAGQTLARAKVANLLASLGDYRFPKSRGQTEITLPLLIDP
jgi:hypothetical protein